MNTTRYTPSDLELVTASTIIVGDVLINFTATGKDIAIPATTRQLARARMFTVPSISSPRTGIVEFGSGPDRGTYTATARVWRVKH